MNAQAERLLSQAEQELKDAQIAPGSLWKKADGTLVTAVTGAIDEYLLRAVVVYRKEHGGVPLSCCLCDWTAIVNGVDGKLVSRFTPYPENGRECS